MSDDSIETIAAAALALFIDAWNRSPRGDPTGPTLYRTLYWPEAELVDPSGNIWEG